MVPAFNAEATIENCLRALLSQTEPRADYEIIVVDDGSTDGTAHRAEQFAGIRTLRVRHSGPAAARNAGARAARAPILLFTDADCEPTPNWIHAMSVSLTDASIAGAKGTYATRQRGLVSRFVQSEYEEKYARMRRVAVIDFVDTYSAAYRREVYLANGGFDESFPSASVEDQEFSFRLAEQGYRLVFAPGAIVYHQHPASLRAYMRRKFWIGYWKISVHRRHPGKLWHDSHTPPTLKIQVALVLGVVASLILAPWFSGAGWIASAGLVALELTAIPLLLRIALHDPMVVLVAPVLVPVRATALASGLVTGLVGELLRAFHRAAVGSSAE